MKKISIKNKNSRNFKVVKKNAKSSVFTHIFSIPKYKRELYLSFHPKDKNIEDKEIKTWTLSSTFTNIQINDLGLLVRDIILLLVEAQSVWTLNILPRVFEYLAESFNRYVIETNQNIYGTKKVNLPKPELYVLYTGKKQIKEKIICLNKEFFHNEAPIDIKINVITLKNASKIVKEYIKFSKELDKNNEKYGFTKKSINETIKYCIEHNILREYLTENKKEVYNIMTSVYDQKTATYMYGREQYAEGKSEGISEGIMNILVRQFRDKKISIEDAANYLNVTKSEFIKLVNTKS